MLRIWRKALWKWCSNSSIEELSISQLKH